MSKRIEAYKKLLAAPNGRLKYHGSGFGDRLRAALCRAHIITMDEVRDIWFLPRLAKLYYEESVVMTELVSSMDARRGLHLLLTVLCCLTLINPETDSAIGSQQFDGFMTRHAARH